MPATPTPLLDALDSQDRIQTAASLSQAVRTNPDTAAKAQRLAGAFGLPVETVQRNMPEVEQRAALQSALGATHEAPKTRAWLADPHNAAVGHDQAPQLASLEGFLNSAFPKYDGPRDYGILPTAELNAVLDGLAQATGGKPGDIQNAFTGALSRGSVSVFGGLAGIHDAAQRAERRATNSIAGIFGQTYAPSTPVGHDRAVALAAETVAGRIADARKPSKDTVATKTAELAGGVAPAIAAAAVNPVLGASIFAAQGADTQAGKSEQVGKAGTPEADAAVGLNAGVQGALGLIPLESIALKFAPKIAAPVGQAVVRTAVAGAAGAGTGVAMQGGSNLISAGMLDPKQDLGEGVADTAGQLGLLGMFLHGVHAAPGVFDHIAGRSQAAGEALDGRARLDAAAEVLKASPLPERAPERLKTLLRDVTDGQDVYVPAQAVREYLQDLKPEERERFADVTGTREQLDASLPAGADIVIGADAYLTYLAPDKAFPGAHDAFKDKLRMGPEAMSAAEAADFEEHYQRFLEEKGQELLDNARRDAETRAPGERVFQDVLSQMRETGATLDASQKVAALMAAHSEAFGKLTGRDAWAEYQSLPLSIKRVLPDSLIRHVDRLDLMLDELRQAKAPPKSPPTLLDFLSKQGLDDTGGELRAMDADIWHKAKPFRKRLIQPNGRTAGDAAINAWEAGYFPDFADEPPTGPQLHEAVRQELAGKPRTAAPLEQRRQDFREGVKQLDEVLGRLGIDPSTATNGAIRGELERMQAEGEEVGRVYSQRSGDDRRGSIDFTDHAAVIRLFQGSDPSTPIHEFGHYFVEKLKRAAAEPDANPEIKAMWETAAQWLGHEGGEITVDQHEQFARGFEAYVMEGRAPSPGLRGVFRRMAQWLTRIYQTVASLNVKLSPEIRDVFDRVLASEDEIRATRAKQDLNPVFAGAEDAGMTQAEFNAYTRAVTRADDESAGRLLNRLTRNIRAARTKEWREERAGVREDVAREIDARPDVKAYWLLAKGELLGAEADAQPARVRLDWDALVEMFGTDAVLRRLPADSYGEGGMHPDAVAEHLGLRSGEHLVERLMSLEETRKELPPGKRDLRKFLTDQETDARMVERHGDPLRDGSIEEEAMDALHDAEQAKVLAMETGALERVSGEHGRWTTALMKRYAADTIAHLKTDDVRPGVYLRAERKAANEAQRQLVKAKPDHAKALEAKRQQLLNFHLYRAAKDAAAEIAAGEKRLNRYASKKTMASVSQPYLQQVHQLLSRFGWRTPDPHEDIPPFSKWVQERAAEGETVVVPDWLLEGGNPTMTVQEFRDLRDTVENVAHLGRETKKLLVNGRRVELEALVAEAQERAKGLKDMPKPPTFDYDARDKGIRAFDAALLKIETMVDWLDDGNPNGVFNRVLIHGASDAHAVENRLFRDVGDKLIQGYDAVPKPVRRSWRTKVEAPELIDPVTGEASVLTKAQVVGIALNTGTKSNLEKLLGGYKWSLHDVHQVLDRALTKADWDYVQSVWDGLSELWPHIVATEKAVTGLSPEKVEVTPVQTPHGEYAGGYFPVAYDPELSAKSRSRNLEDLFNQFMVGVSTPKGHTISRTAYKAPILLSPHAVVFDHVNKVIKRIAYAEYASSARRFIEDPRIRAIWSEKVGPIYYKEAMPWLYRQVGYRMIDPRALGAAERFWRAARVNFTTAASAIRATVLFEHAAALPQSAAVIGEGWLARGFAEYAGLGMSAEKFVFDRSEEMRFRGQEVSRDIRDALSDLKGKPGVLNRARELAHKPVSWVNQYAVAMPTWLGGYRRALAEGMSDPEAIRYADKAVRTSHSTGAAKDMARAQDPAGEFYKLATMFYGYHNAQYQLQRRLVWSAGHAQNAADAAHVFHQGLLILLLAPIVGSFSAGHIDTSDPEKAAGDVFDATMRGLWGGIPYVRDVANATLNKLEHKPGEYELSPIARGINNAIAVVADAAQVGLNVTGFDNKEPSHRWLQHLVDGGGFLSGLPLGQVGTSAQYLKDVADGTEEPDGPVDFAHGLLFGPHH